MGFKLYVMSGASRVKKIIVSRVTVAADGLSYTLQWKIKSICKSLHYTDCFVGELN